VNSEEKILLKLDILKELNEKEFKHLNEKIDDQNKRFDHLETEFDKKIGYLGTGFDKKIGYLGD
jgi:hypothetical protein